MSGNSFHAGNTPLVKVFFSRSKTGLTPCTRLPRERASACRGARFVSSSELRTFPCAPSLLASFSFVVVVAYEWLQIERRAHAFAAAAVAGSPMFQSNARGRPSEKQESTYEPRLLKYVQYVNISVSRELDRDERSANLN